MNPHPSNFLHRYRALHFMFLLDDPENLVLLKRHPPTTSGEEKRKHERKQPRPPVPNRPARTRTKRTRRNAMTPPGHASPKTRPQAWQRRSTPGQPGESQKLPSTQDVVDEEERTAEAAAVVQGRVLESTPLLCADASPSPLHTCKPRTHEGSDHVGLAPPRASYFFPFGSQLPLSARCLQRTRTDYTQRSREMMVTVMSPCFGPRPVGLRPTKAGWLLRVFMHIASATRR